MNQLHSVAYALAALEVVPGNPSDLNRLLVDAPQWASLVGGDSGADATDLGEYLRVTLDPNRVIYWLKVVQAGVESGSYRPMLLTDADYPLLLKTVWDAPPVLFRSTSDATHAAPTHAEPSIAIIGGRETAQAVLDNTFEVAAAVASEGARVISGLAAGVDAAAHWGALSVGGATTAVLGTGIERVFPEQNRELAARVANDGVLLSQFAPAAPRTGTTFLRRNHVIAGASSMTLIMDGRERSGSRHEVDQAVSYGRPVLMWAPAMLQERWARELAESGKGEFVESSEEVVARVARSTS